MVDAARIRLAVCGAALCIGALLLAPLAAAPPSASDDAGDVALREFEEPLPAQIPSRQLPVLSRDPFASTGSAPARPAATPEAAAVQRAQAPAIQLIAVITGARDRALLVEEGRSRIVARGDPVGGTRVRAIDAGGIVLDDGTILHLTDPLR